MKRVFALFLCLVMVLSLAACGARLLKKLWQKRLNPQTMQLQLRPAMFLR